MPYGVSKWPGAADPRGTAFCAEGFLHGAFPAYRYLLKTVGAQPPFGFLNAGITIDYFAGIPGHHKWQRLNGSGIPFNIFFDIFGYEDVQHVPIDFTVNWQLEIHAVGFFTHFGEAFALYPNAITGWPAIQTAVGTGGTLLIPNPVTITPRIWNYPSTP